MLPCRVQREVGSVTWSKGPQLKGAEIIVIYQNLKGGWEKTIYGDIEGLYDIESNFSLVINNVMVEHSDLFYCDVLDTGSGRSISNHTNVQVFGKHDIDIENFTITYRNTCFTF